MTVSENKKEKVLVGKVVSDKMNKTRVVKVSRTLIHEKYSKVITRNKKIMMHDEKNESKIGDVVEMAYSRPLSKNKSWKLIKILEKANEEIQLKEEQE